MKKAAARQIAELVPGILSDTLARRTGMTLDLIAGWDDIAGPDYAPFTLPEKILWPRQGGDDEPFEPATLVLACEGHRALFIQHAMPELMDRLNRFFGYGAVGRIRLVQKPVGKPAPAKHRRKPELTEEESRRLAEVLDEIGNDGLRESLARFGRGVIAKRRNTR
ncbi:DUF721 domain-containing protein [Salaquimonas pukyongi]|uniref:DUF721 domain-containing protein n=1 Tax=Salaquimonas pukyongi TaxID=2712698 RepID=UPI00096BB00D|nr:DciA family protein [Salaquimonas pukyongi]